MATWRWCEDKDVKRPVYERLRETLEDPTYEVTVKAMMEGVTRRSVGKKTVELMCQTMTDTSATLACLMADESLCTFPIARTAATWHAWSSGWYVDVLRTRLAFIAIGRRGQTGVGNLFISSPSLDPIAVPISLVMGKNPQRQSVAEWIRCHMPDLHQIMRNKLVFKVVTPAGELFA